jgi:DNA-binding NarL/FixJ family response regulator
MTRTRILLADDHEMLLDGLVSLLGTEFDIVGVARDGRSLVDLARRHHPEVIVVDIAMPQLNGIDAVRILRKESTPSKILFLSMHMDLPIVEEAFRAGASGYVLKVGAVDELIKAIQCVVRGGSYISPVLAGDLISSLLTASSEPVSRQTTLTSRQREVLQLLAEGKTMKEIGALLNISTRTTESHKYEIMRHLGLKTTAELIRYAVRIKLV